MSKAIFTEDDFQEFDDAEDGRYAAKEANSKVAPLFEKLEAQLKVAREALGRVQRRCDLNTEPGMEPSAVYYDVEMARLKVLTRAALAEIDRIAKEGLSE